MKGSRYDTQRNDEAHPRGSLEKKLLAYSAAAGVVLAGAGAEEAQAQACTPPSVLTNGICYTDVNPDQVLMGIGGAAASVAIDFDDGLLAPDPEFTLNHQSLPNIVRLVYNKTPPDTGINPVAGFSSFARGPSTHNPGALLKSDSINLMQPNAIPNSLGRGSIANFPGKGQRFAGVKLKIGTTQHTGWIRVSVAPNSTSVTLYDYAYQTAANTPILAGDTGAGVLPVELTTFEATTDAQAVLLRWHTASETNNAGFEVQHQQGDDWRAVGFVEGRGTTTAPQTYQHRLSGLEPGTHHFRLKQVDFDGAFAFSSVVEAAVEVPGTHALSPVYPNPFNPRASFTLAVKEAQQVRVALFDALGREAQVLHDGLLEGGETHRFEIAGGDLPSGFYLVRAIGERFEATQPATLVK